MVSRRLDISSLLCNDEVPEPVILPPHLRHPSSSSGTFYNHNAPSPSTSPTFPPPSHHPLPSHTPSSHPLLSPLPHPYPLSVSSPHHFPSPSSAVPPKLPSFGLEALVQAATEERRRLSGGNFVEPDVVQRPSPPFDQRHIPRPHQFHHQQPFRQHKPSNDPSHSPIQHHSPILSPVQAVRSPIQSIRSPVQNARSPVYSPLIQNSSQSLHRVTERLYAPHDEPQIRPSPVEDRHYGPHQTSYLSPQSSRHRMAHDQRMQQQHELHQRQRQHHEQLLLQEQQQQQKLARERQVVYGEPALPPTSHAPSVPLHVEVPSPPHTRPSSSLPSHTTGRKSDPGHPLADPMLLLSVRPAQSLSGDGFLQPSRKRRYSDSPVHSMSAHDKERMHHERVTVPAGDVGHAPVDIVNSVGPRRPGSGHGVGRKHLGLAEIITPDREMEPLPREIQTLLSPPGRRSPPGSQTGRAIAARKTEEIEHTIHDSVRQVSPDPYSLEKKGSYSWPAVGVLTVSETLSKTKPPHSRHLIEVPTSSEIPLIKAKPRLLPSPVAKATEEDAHEWFLEHFDEYNGPTVPRSLQSSFTPSAPSPSSTVPLATSIRRESVSPIPKQKKQASTPVTMPEAAVALEQELEELISAPSGYTSKVESDIDMDVDLVVTELVAETLEADDPRTQNVGMEVDVEDELLSLVDDRPVVRRPVAKSAIPGSLTTKSTPRLDSSTVRQASPTATSLASAPSPASFFPPIVRPLSARPASERESMPPPTSVTPGRSKDREAPEQVNSATSAATKAKKKKDVPSKPATKHKVPAGISTTTAVSSLTTARSKPGPKPKAKTSDTSQIIKARSTLKNPNASRSRSTSMMPSGSAGPESSETKAEKREEEEESDSPEDNKLYCVCKTKYDEDRFMIACDRCDEWYHTQCVDLPDLEVDLVDQFICPSCIAKNPHLSLRTTYKPRCLNGLRHTDPVSPKACHRPARGAFSKYCSDECGVKYMRSRAEAWVKKGGKRDKLWETVKNAEKREGVVVCVDEQKSVKMEIDDTCRNEKIKGLKQKKGKIEREVERLNGLLGSVVRLREEIKRGTESVVWRGKLLELATERAEQVGECGWDQRLCFGDEEWADFGTGILESYDGKAHQADVTPEDSGEWWCPMKKTCDRHAGWQTIRYRDVCKEKEKTEDALSNLTTRERELRKRIEDILDPGRHACNDSPPGKPPLKASNAKPMGHAKGKINGDTTTKKGKKRKATS